MLSDLRYAFRSLRKSPGYTVVALLTLALGIGASAVVFSVVNAVVLRPLAFPASERLVAARIVVPAYAKLYPTLPVNARFFREWRALPAFSELALIDRSRSTITGAGDPVRVSALRCSANLFSVLRVSPALGRSFAANEDAKGKAPVAIVSDRFWRNRLAADPAVLDRTITLDQQPFTVIGVLPADFRLPEAHDFLTGKTSAGEPEVFISKQFDADELNVIAGRFNYDVIGRLAPGVTPAAALAQMNVVAARLAGLAKQPGLELRGYLAPLQEAVVGPARRGLFLLLGAIGAVLLIACLNLSMLALARAERQSRDRAVRSALGASRGRLVREALAESVLLSIGGGVLGCLCASWGLDLLLRFAPGDLPRLDEVSLDSTVLLFALGTTIVTAFIAGLTPAWRAARTATASLHGSANRTVTGSVGARRLRHLLIAIETGVSTLLLAVAALLAASFIRLLHTDAGFHAPHTYVVDLAIPYEKYRSDADRIAYHQRLLTEVAATAGVNAAAISTALPLQGETWIDTVWTLDDTRPQSQRPNANIRFISADFFNTLGIPFLGGRTFRDTDRNAKVAVISARLAATLWPGLNPIGRKFSGGNDEVLEVIGLVGDVRANADQRPAPVVYKPYWASAPADVSLVVKTSTSVVVLASALRQTIHRIDADVPVGPLRTMSDLLESSVAVRHFQLRLVLVFALSALTLAGLGVYGVVSHSVAQRTRELGIRLAFGASSTALRGLVLRQGFAPIAWGLLGGILAALAGGRLVASLLFETNARDPLTLAAVALILAFVALIACWLPARRATRVDPMIALRAE